MGWLFEFIGKFPQYCSSVVFELLNRLYGFLEANLNLDNALLFLPISLFFTIRVSYRYIIFFMAQSSRALKV